MMVGTDNAHCQDPKMTDLIARQKIAGWEKLKILVLDSVSSPITKRVYRMALNKFMSWFQEAPRPGFTKATVSAWRVSLEDRRLGSSWKKQKSLPLQGCERCTGLLFVTAATSKSFSL